ncbi:MAG: hypothetical protein AB7S26_29125 [Sandaracinaceae bacterium]
MDPTACARRFLSAIDEGDTEEARDAATDLVFWLSAGGFLPELTDGEHRRLWSAVSELAHIAVAWERAEL